MGKKRKSLREEAAVLVREYVKSHPEDLPEPHPIFRFTLPQAHWPKLHASEEPMLTPNEFVDEAVQIAGPATPPEEKTVTEKPKDTTTGAIVFDKKVSLDKTYKTRGGHDVKLYAIGEGQDFGVHGAFCIENTWCMHSWNLSGLGSFVRPCSYDLVEVKPKHTLDLWVYPGPCRAYDQRARADDGAGPDRVACVHIVQEYTEGEGLCQE